MSATLVEALHSIERLPDIVNIDKKKELKKLLDEFRKTHDLVNKSANGEISIPIILEELYEKYKGWRILLPKFEDEEYDRRLEELNLKELLSNPDLFRTNAQLHYHGSQYINRGLGWAYDKLTNPISLALVVGGLVTLMYATKATPGNEIAHYSTGFGLGAALGAMMGIIASMLKYDFMMAVRNDAKYLDAKIREVYQPK